MSRIAVFALWSQYCNILTRFKSSERSTPIHANEMVYCKFFGVNNPFLDYGFLLLFSTSLWSIALCWILLKASAGSFIPRTRPTRFFSKHLYASRAAATSTARYLFVGLFTRANMAQICMDSMNSKMGMFLSILRERSWTRINAAPKASVKA